MYPYKQFKLFIDDGVSPNPQQRMFSYIEQNDLHPLCYFKTAAFYELNKRKKITNHAFSFAATWSEFYSKMKHLEIKDIHTKKPTMHTMEIIKTGQKCKPYLDIEYIVNTEDEHGSKREEFLMTLKMNIIKVFETEYKHQITSEDISYIRCVTKQ